MSRLGMPLDTSRTGKEAAALENGLRRLIIGQDDAIRELVNIYQMYLTGMSAPGRPVGNLLFLGPTGSGKTRTVEAAAECLLGNPNAVIKIDCGEFQHSHEIAKLIGSPPGYLGHRETHPLLSQEVLGQYYTDKVKLSFVLFDEIEKASDALWNLLLGILDKATLTLGDNRRVDFSRVLVFMTSNLGAAEMERILNPRLGFHFHGPQQVDNEEIAVRIEETAVDAARRKFTPEFINRLDKIVVFRPLGESELSQVLDLELRLLQERIFRSAGARPFIFQLSAAARQQLLAEGTDPRYGARPIKRAIEKLLVQPMSNLLASGQLKHGDSLRVDFDDAIGQMLFFKDAEGLTVCAMAEATGTSLAALPAAA